MSFGNPATIKLPFRRLGSFGKIVNKNLPINFRSMHRGAAFKKQVAFFRGAHQQQIEFMSHQRFFLRAADLLLNRHQRLSAPLDFTWRNFAFQIEGACAFLVGVAEGSHPVETGLLGKFAEFFEFFFRFPGKADYKRCTQREVRNRAPHFLDRTEEQFRSSASLHALQYGCRSMLQWHINVGTDVVMGGDGFKQASCDLVGIGVQESNPSQSFDAGEFLKQQGQAVFQSQVLAIASRVLADQRDFANARLRQPLGLGNHGFEAPRTKLSAQLRNDAKRAGMITALGNLDVSRVARGREYARCRFVVQIIGQIGDGAVPCIAGETALLPPMVAFRARSQNIEWARSRACRRHASGCQDAIQFAGTNDGIHLGNIIQDLAAKPFHQAACHDQFSGSATVLVFRHL